MKTPAAWTEDDLLHLIQAGVEEGLDLVYRPCSTLDGPGADPESISRDVSALANSAGGAIVYGMVTRGRAPMRIDRGFAAADGHSITAEWLDRLIRSSVRRPIDGVRVRSVPLKGAHQGRVVYVVSVP